MSFVTKVRKWFYPVKNGHKLLKHVFWFKTGFKVPSVKVKIFVVVVKIIR